jgi:transposase
MPKKAYLADHLSTEELKDAYRLSQDPVESRRWHFLWKIALGWSVKNSTLAVGISESYGWTILKNYNSKGKEGVKNQKKESHAHRRGSKPILDEEQFLKLTEALKQKPEDGGIWTGPKVARWLAKETKREVVHPQRGWDYLKKCNYSWQKPRPKHKKADEVEQEKFKKDLLGKVEKIQETYRDSKIEVWFFDEHRVGLKPILRKVWAKVGERPIATVQHRYEWLYVYGFVEPKTGKTHWYLIPRVNTKCLNLVYQAFAKDVGLSAEKRIVLIQDNAGWHKSKDVIVPEGIHVEYLPAYSPELQPAERLWSLVDEPLVNEYFESIEEMEEILAKRCCTLQDMQQDIKNLTNYHWLKYE